MPPTHLYEQRSFAPLPISYSSETFVPLVLEDHQISHVQYLLWGQHTSLARFRHYLTTCSTIFSFEQTLQELQDNWDFVFVEFVPPIPSTNFSHSSFKAVDACTPLFQLQPQPTPIQLSHIPLLDKAEDVPLLKSLQPDESPTLTTITLPCPLLPWLLFAFPPPFHLLASLVTCPHSSPNSTLASVAVLLMAISLIAWLKVRVFKDKKGVVLRISFISCWYIFLLPFSFDLHMFSFLCT